MIDRVSFENKKITKIGFVQHLKMDLSFFIQLVMIFMTLLQFLVKKLKKTKRKNQ